MTSIQGFIREALNLNSIELVDTVSSGPDCECRIYQSETKRIFAKICTGKNSKELCHGEYTGLLALEKCNLLCVPEPITVINTGKSTILITEYIHFSPLRLHHSKLGQLLADCEDAVRSFGFSATVCCGSIPVNNTWNNDWITGNKEILDLWTRTKPNVSKLFEGITVLPSLLHGDLWSGNTGEIDQEPVVFDPASFYGHSEFDLAIATIFGGFDSDFFLSYFEILPKEPGYENRQLLYQLFHYLNHWNLFGGSYRRQSLSLMREIMNVLGLLNKK